MTLRRQKRRGRNYDFSRHRQRRAAHRHENDDAYVASGKDPPKPQFQKMVHEKISDFRFQI
jgi:hypothetical protein